MKAILDGLVPGLPIELAARILERAEGVPLYAMETVRMLLDRGVVVQDGHRYVVTGSIQDLDVPETLQALAAARLDNLAPVERGLLQDAAVLGSSFSASALAAVSERRESDVRQTLDALLAKQVLGRDDDPRSSEQGQYFFLQGLLHTISLGTLSRRERKARHLAAAQHFEVTWGDDAGEIAEVLASHYLDAIAAEPDAADVPEIRQRARETLVAAGRRAVSMALGGEARALFERAAELAEGDADRASLLSEAGVAAARSDREQGAQLLEEAISLLDAAGREEDAALTRLRLAEVLIGLNRMEQAKELTVEAEGVLRDPGPRAETAGLRGRIAFLQGDFALTRDQSELALSIADPLKLAPVIADASMNKAIALMYDLRLSEAGAMMTLALDVAIEADLAEAALRAYYNLAEFRVMNGDVGAAVDLIERGLELARERGIRSWERDLLSQSCEVDVVRGEWDRMLATTQSLEESGADESYRVASSQLPVVFAARGETAALEQFLDAPRVRSEWAELAMMEALGEAIALQATGHLDEAISRVESRIEQLSSFQGAVAAEYILESAEILLSGGRRDLLPSISGSTHRSSPIMAPQRLQVRALFDSEEGDTEAAERAFREALAQLRRIDAPFMLGRCLHYLSALLARTGRGDEAAVLLEESDELFRQVGAAAWLERNAALTPREVVA
jgi:tetratricopeptide (TPR) repeat protein